MKFPRLVHNRLSYAGLAVAGLALVAFALLAGLNALLGTGRAPYAGLLIFVAVPSVLLLGLLLVPLGMALEWLRWRHVGGRPMPVFPVIDLNNPHHRNAMAVFVVGTIVLVSVLSLSSYRAYHYTESVAFCGTLCHAVMKPEYTTYQQSPHARVACVDCHVGPGATWFVRSKLSGVPQIYYTLRDSYPRPIQTPVKNLRPAQETCEQCHWPDAFFGGQQKRLIHFLPDQANTRWEIELLIKTGGGSPQTSQTEGIHWHMNIANRIEYIAADAQRQNIPWVRITDVRTGTSTVFTAGSPLSDEAVAVAGVRRMDCMDCHNRPTHIFRAPDYAVNLALATGKLDRSLPFIKRTTVELLAARYDSEAAGLAGIEAGLRKFYSERYPRIAANQGQALTAAVRCVQELFRENEFPEMKVRWDTHADDVGHLNAPGCFRCHDGQHRAASGAVITRECRACHTILAEGSPGQIGFAADPQGLDFQHPVDVGEAWKETACSDCHTGGPQ
jgi:nitrate/TMAO reductase-like tetraheme cytochrome c subunit